jgi:hypothetical protein
MGLTSFSVSQGPSPLWLERLIQQNTTSFGGSVKMKKALRIIISLAICAFIAAGMLAIFKRLSTDYDGPRTGSFSIVEDQ